jgi:hypothetical protein
LSMSKPIKVVKNNKELALYARDFITAIKSFMIQVPSAIGS